MTTHEFQDRSEASLAFEAYWRKIGNTRAATQVMPAFEDFDPLDIPHLIPNLLSCDLQLAPNPDMKIRFSGSITHDQSGFNLTGLNPESFFDETTLKSVWASLVPLVKLPCGLLQRNDVLYESAQNAVTEMLVLPTSTSSPERFILVCLLEWIGYHHERSDEHPMRILPSTQYSWIDLGRGVPDL